MASITLLSMVVILCSISFIHGAPKRNVGNGRDKFRGLKESDFKQMEACVKRVKIKNGKAHGKQITEDQITDTLFGDIAVTYEQCLAMERHPGRNKRKAVADLSQRWTLPIKYYITSDFSASAEAQIRLSFQRWEESTCLRFTEVSSGYSGGKHLEIKGNEGGCWSYVGAVFTKQPINLGSGCTGTVATPMHEIAHALGMHHEQSRQDRDQYITVNYDNIDRGNYAQFDKEDYTVTYNVPYDYGSVMQYYINSFSRNGGYTIDIKLPEYRYGVGQERGASYMDVTLANRMYQCDCSGSTLTCSNGGYPDTGTTANCASCRCPDGLGGDCTQAATGSEGCTPVSGDISVTNTNELCLESPNYGSSYSVNDKCSWLLTAPVGKKIQLRFDLSGGFGVYHTTYAGGVCYHWVEIKYTGNFTHPGPKFCGSSGYTYNQNEQVLSDGNEVLIHFNAEMPEISTGERTKGFKLCYKQVDSAVTIPTPSPPTPATAAPCIKRNPRGKCVKGGRKRKNQGKKG